MTDRTWFSFLLQHPARKWSGSTLTTPEPARGTFYQLQPVITLLIIVRSSRTSPGRYIWFGSWLARLNTFSSRASISGRVPQTRRWSLNRDKALRLFAATLSENVSVVERTRTSSSGSIQQANDLKLEQDQSIT